MDVVLHLSISEFRSPVLGKGMSIGWLPNTASSAGGFELIRIRRTESASIEKTQRIEYVSLVLLIPAYEYIASANMNKKQISKLPHLHHGNKVIAKLGRSMTKTFSKFAKIVI